MSDLPQRFLDVLAEVLVRQLVAWSTWRAGFQWKIATVPDPRAADGGGSVEPDTDTVATPRTTCDVHYLERAPAVSDTSSLEKARTLVLIPGLTMEASTFLSFVTKLNLPSTYRVVIVELPGQGANR